MYMGMGVIWTSESCHKFITWISFILELTLPKYLHVCLFQTFKTFSILLSKCKYRKSVNTVQYNEKIIYMSNLFEF